MANKNNRMFKKKIGRPSTERNIHRVVKNMIRSSKEVKNVAVSLSYANTVAGVVSEISRLIVQGDNINQRSGDQIMPMHLDINYTLTSGVGSTNALHRIIIFQDTMNLGTLPTVAQVLDGASYISTYTIVANQQRRWKVLHDRIHGVVGASNSAATHVQRRIPMKGAIFYNGTAAAATDNGRGAIYIMTLTDSVAVSSSLFTFQGGLFYTDS